MYVRRIQLDNWKNFRTPGSIDLSWRMFLVGPNASGKSNFLDAFRFLRDLCVPGGGLQQAVTKRGGVSAIRCLAARQQPDIAIDVELEEPSRGPKPDLWRYRLAFAQDNNSRPLLREEAVEHNGASVLTRPDDDDQRDKLRLSQTAIEQIVANQKFRPIADFFKNIAYQHLLPQIIRDPNSFSPAPVRDDPFGRDFLRRVANTKPKSRDARLRWILEALKVAVPQLSKLQVEIDEADGTPHLIGSYEHWRPHANRQNESQFSDGTLRLFGILWSVLEGDGLLLMEEPELSLHEELVRHLPQLFERIHRHKKQRRQVFVSTHSRRMLEDLGINGDETLVLEPSKNGTLIHSLNDDEADVALLRSGLSVGEVALPRSAPKGAEQLLLWFATQR